MQMQLWMELATFICLVINSRRSSSRTPMQNKNPNYSLVVCNEVNRQILVGRHTVAIFLILPIISPFKGALYPEPMVAEGFSSVEQPKEVRKYLIATGKIPILQGLQHVHALVQNLFPQEQRSDLPFFFSREKRRRIQCGCKLEKIESKHILCPFQNGGSFSFKGTAFERGLFMQVGLEGRILHRGSSQIIQEVCKGSLEGGSLRVSLPVLRSRACPKDFHKAYENSNCINKTSECLVDNIFRRHVINGKLIGGNYDGKGHIDFYIATSRVCDKLSEVDSDTMPSNSILRGGNRLNHYNHISSSAEEGTDYSAMQRYIEPIRRFLKAVNLIDRPALVNSKSYSSSASLVPSFATSTNVRTSGETEFSCTHSPVRRSEGRNSVVDRKFDVVQRGTNNISTSSTSYNFGRFHARVGGSLSRTNNRGSVDTRGTEKSYKHIRAEGSSVGNFDVHLYPSTSTFNTFANRQYGGSFLYSENGGGGGGGPTTKFCQTSARRSGTIYYPKGSQLL